MMAKRRFQKGRSSSVFVSLTPPCIRGWVATYKHPQHQKSIQEAKNQRTLRMMANVDAAGVDHHDITDFPW